MVTKLKSRAHTMKSRGERKLLDPFAIELDRIVAATPFKDPEPTDSSRERVALLKELFDQVTP